MAGTVITVASGKGGVGKTTTAVNLAVALWTEDYTVALVDADLGMANLAAVLGLEPEVTLHDVLAGEADLWDAVIEANDGDLLVLPGERSLSGFAAAKPDALGDIVDELAEHCAYVVVDTGAGLSYEDLMPLGLADEVLLVTTPDPAAVGDTRKTLSLAEILGVPVRGVLVNKAAAGTDAEAVAAEVGADLVGTIPEDPAVTDSTRAGDPLASHAPESEAAAAYTSIATAIISGGPIESDADAEPVADAVATGPDDELAESGDTPEPAPEGEASPEPSDADASTAEPTGDEEESPDDEASAPAEPDAEDADADEDSADDSTEPDENVDDDPEDDDEPKQRGGLTGWLGRLFS